MIALKYASRASFVTRVSFHCLGPCGKTWDLCSPSDGYPISERSWDKQLAPLLSPLLTCPPHYGTSTVRFNWSRPTPPISQTRTNVPTFRLRVNGIEDAVMKLYWENALRAPLHLEQYGGLNLGT